MAPAEVFYDGTEAKKYTSSSRIIDVQAQMAHRCIELMALPPGHRCFILDIGCGSGLSGGEWAGLPCARLTTLRHGQLHARSPMLPALAGLAAGPRHQRPSLATPRGVGAHGVARAAGSAPSAFRLALCRAGAPKRRAVAGLTASGRHGH